MRCEQGVFCAKVPYFLAELLREAGQRCANRWRLVTSKSFRRASGTPRHFVRPSLVLVGIYCHTRIRNYNVSIYSSSHFYCTQFGGNLFAMTDPFWMIMTMQALGRDYIVWDKAGAIDFVAPGRETVYAEFRLDETVLDEIRAATANGEKYLRWFDTEVKTAAGDVVARVRKQIYVRRKRPM